jgi:hypothetical protein
MAASASNKLLAANGFNKSEMRFNNLNYGADELN